MPDRSVAVPLHHGAGFAVDLGIRLRIVVLSLEGLHVAGKLAGSVGDCRTNRSDSPDLINASLVKLYRASATYRGLE